MLDRNELVTLALLGTDRRPVTGLTDADRGDPVGALLDEAARSALAARAGQLWTRQSAAPPGPGGVRLGLAPPEAQAILGRLLAQPHPGTLNLWLAAAVDQGCGAAPQLWPELAAAASRLGEVARPLLSQVLGERGRWFVAQNPAWSRLASTWSTGTSPPVEPERDPRPTGPGPTPQDVVAEPELVLTAPPPWSVDLTRAVLAVIGAGALQRRTTGYAVAVGVRMPLAHYSLVQAAASYAADPGGGRLASSAVARAGYAALDQTLYLRAEIHNAFTPADPIVLIPQESP